MSVQDESQQVGQQQTAPVSNDQNSTSEHDHREGLSPENGDAEGHQQDQQDQGNDGQQQERDDKGRFKGGVQSRIDELTRLRHEAEREAAYWRGRAGNGGAGDAGKEDSAQPSAPEAATKPKPTPDQFDDYGEYIEALTEWKAEEKVSKALTEREAKAAQAQQAAVRATTWEQRQAATRSALPDYDAVVGASDAPVAQHVAETLQESEHGPALAYHLAKHPEVLERLNGMSPRQADREIGRLEERLAATANAASGETDAPAVKTTQAPKPASVTSSQGRSVAQDPSRMSPEEYVQWRSKGPNKARWAR